MSWRSRVWTVCGRPRCSSKRCRSESHRYRQGIGALFDIYPEGHDVWAGPCQLLAGGALLHNGLTLHGAGANMMPG